MNDQDLLNELKEATKAQIAKEEGIVETNKEEPVDAQVETQKESLDVSEEQPEYSEIEKEALSQGWKPNYNGPNKKSAEDFVRDGSFFKKIAEQKQQIQELKDAFKNLSSHQQKVEKAAYQKALNDLKKQRDSAIEQGDVLTANQLDEHIYSTRDQIKTFESSETVNQSPVVSKEELHDFSSRNKEWFNVALLNKNPSELSGKELQDYKMTKAAFTYDDYLGMKVKSGELNLSPQEALKEVENFIRDTYADRFSNPKRDEAASTSKSTSSNSASLGKLTSKLTDRQKELYKMYVSFDPKFGSLEDYAKQLDSIGELKK